MQISNDRQKSPNPFKQTLFTSYGSQDRRKIDKKILDKENIPNFLENAFQFDCNKKRNLNTREKRKASLDSA